ncbi:Acetolactate synthase [Penicillium rolfsii]|nr:Acetolactate synthase [Penicillium rolfsii]
MRAKVESSLLMHFGYPGGAALPLFDGIQQSHILHFILSRHEQGAGHMAEGYASATGKPGVVLVTSGPGISNLATPMFDAQLDGIPLVIICGQVATSAIGTDAFQEIDVSALAKTCTKWHTTVQAVEDLPLAIETAFREATEGRPGPVLVAIPQDIGSSTCSSIAVERKEADFVDLGQGKVVSLQPQRSLCVSHDSLRQVANLMNAAERPVIIAGHGVFQSSKGPLLLDTISSLGQIPVATTLLGLGCFDEMKIEALHMVGTYGAIYANYAIQNADLIISLGARLDERVVGDPEGFAPKARTEGRGGVVYFGIEPKSIGKLIKPTHFIQGDLSITLPLLLSYLQKRVRPEWYEQIQKWKTDYPFPPNAEKVKHDITPAEVLSELDRQIRSLSPSRAIFCTGVGQHQMWAARCLRWRASTSLVTSGSLGTMGFGLPASIGAKVGSPDSLVITIDGDGSFCMTMEELLTASSNGVGVKVIIFNNKQQKMIAQLQQKYYQGRVAYANLINPDFVMLARSMGCDASRCTLIKDLPNCIHWLLRTERPALLDIALDNEPSFFPLVRKGAALDCFLSE